MSLKYMKAIWDIKLPATTKFVALAIADFANDKGECWPSVPAIAQKTGHTERTIFRALSELRNGGILTSQKKPGRPTFFAFESDILEGAYPCHSVTPTPDTQSPLPMTESQYTPDTVSSPPLTHSHPPLTNSQSTPDTVSVGTYREPSKNRNEPCLSRTRENDTPTEKNFSSKESEWKKSRFGWDKFWAAYPRKSELENALKKWLLLQPSEELVETILANIQNRLNCGQWDLAEKGFITRPERYLASRAWEDELAPRRKAAAQAPVTPPTDQETSSPEALPELTAMDPQTWEDALHKCALEYPEDTEAWIKPLRPLGVADGGTVYLAASSPFNRGWVASNYKDLISRCLQAEVKLVEVSA